MSSGSDPSAAPTPPAVPTPPAAPAAPAAPARQRVALWDNARFLLILLVVVAHAVTTVRTDTALGYGVYAFIYLFHMPAMIMLSGLFSKPEVTPSAVRSTLQLLGAWIVWEGVWALIHFFVEGRGLPRTWLISPAWTLWFLLTLVTMRILLPYFARLRHPLLWSIVLALAAGLSPAIGSEFSASRTLCFLPFFVAGWLAKDRGWFAGDWFTRPTKLMRGLAWTLLGLIALVFVLWPSLKSHWRIDKWLTWRDDYGWLFSNAPIGGFAPETWWVIALGGAAVRSVLLAVAAAMTLALLMVISRRSSRMTAWGTRTLAVYLLHAPIIWTLRSTGAIDAIGELGAPGVPIVMALGAAIALVLSAEWVTRLSKPLISPPIDWLLLRLTPHKARNIHVLRSDTQ